MVDTATCHLDPPQGRTGKSQLPQRLSARGLHWSAAESPSLAATPLPELPAFVQGLTHAGYKGLTASDCCRSTLKAIGAPGLPGGEGGGEGGWLIPSSQMDFAPCWRLLPSPQFHRCCFQGFCPEISCTLPSPHSLLPREPTYDIINPPA